MFDQLNDGSPQILPVVVEEVETTEPSTAADHVDQSEGSEIDLRLVYGMLLILASAMLSAIAFLPTRPSGQHASAISAPLKGNSGQLLDTEPSPASAANPTVPTPSVAKPVVPVPLAPPPPDVTEPIAVQVVPVPCRLEAYLPVLTALPSTAVGGITLSMTPTAGSSDRCILDVTIKPLAAPDMRRAADEEIASPATPDGPTRDREGGANPGGGSPPKPAVVEPASVEVPMPRVRGDYFPEPDADGNPIATHFSENTVAVSHVPTVVALPHGALRWSPDDEIPLDLFPVTVGLLPPIVVEPGPAFAYRDVRRLLGPNLHGGHR